MFQTLTPKDRKIRKLPYPFEGAISISSDIEYMGFDFFEAFMNFVNTKNQTPLGLGLGLEVTSSMFFYSADMRTFSYFDGVSENATKSRYADRIDNYLLSGWIDTNHSYGDFFSPSNFTRKHAIRCFDVLKSLGVCLPIFTNHGGNASNFGKQSEIYSGDLVEHSVYNADLLKAHLTRYIWLDAGRYVLEDQPLKGIPKYLIKQILGYGDRQYLRWRSELFRPISLRDKSKFKGFLRLRSTGRYAPDFSSLGRQLKQIRWKDFYRKSGISIIYQHLGVMSQNNSKCISSNVKDVLLRKEVFLTPLYFLQHESMQGRLWVSGTARLLLYAEVVESATINYDKALNRYVIELDIDLPLPPQKLLQGLTFYIDPNLPVELFYKNTKINIVYNGPDETKQYSVSVPIQPLNDIWKEKN